MPVGNARPLSLLCALALLSATAGFAAPAARADAAFGPGDLVVVTTTEGDRLSLRDGPGLDATVLTTLAEGTVLTVLDGPRTSADGMSWYHVDGEGWTGWCVAEYLAAAGAGPGAPAAPGGAPAGGALQVTGTGDEGLRLRDGPTLGAGIVLVIPEGAGVAVTGDLRAADGYQWAPVQYGGASGWVAAAFLGPAGGAPAAAAPESAGATPAATPLAAPAPAQLAVGDHAVVSGTDGNDLRIRDGIGPDAPLFAYAPAGAVLVVVNGPQADASGTPWYGVDYDGVQGWVDGEYLAPTAAAPSSRPSLTMATAGVGQAIADAAAKYVGTPYVWGGASPAGWDCSGMIVYIYKQVAGVTLPRTSQEQFLIGAPLRQDEIQPGDLVFFADTDGPGITHNGIALGGGRFVHARSERYGTVIDNLSDPYWVAHYAGARRP
ncbi:MAG TPA: C40 family peptidase [Thermomicrobiales bacterium]|nr:C40 family peptidase [Thermomicrobiales bacterium]